MAGRSGMSSNPYFQIYLNQVEDNLDRLSRLEHTSGINILHTLKSIQHPKLLQMLSSSISGTSVGSKAELRLASDAKSRHIHLYSPAFSEEEFPALASEADTLSLNSLGQWELLQTDHSSMGLRLNPMLDSSMPTYCNPNLPDSHLGVNYREFLERFISKPEDFSRLEGLHFHALYRSGVEGIASLLVHIHAHYQSVLPQLQWLNLGGGHALTDPDYDLDALQRLLMDFFDRHPHIKIYLEPGEATFSGTSEFVTTILDIIPHPDADIVILNTSTETHLLDSAIHNIQPLLSGSKPAAPYRYKFCGNSCLQGDILGIYHLDTPLQRGDYMVFKDMASYTMAKMTQFNGHPYPDIVFIDTKETP
jgi:carboxynorspermidine decarboxylase